MLKGEKEQADRYVGRGKYKREGRREAWKGGKHKREGRRERRWDIYAS